MEKWKKIEKEKKITALVQFPFKLEATLLQ